MCPDDVVVRPLLLLLPPGRSIRTFVRAVIDVFSTRRVLLLLRLLVFSFFLSFSFFLALCKSGIR